MGIWTSYNQFDSHLIFVCKKVLLLSKKSGLLARALDEGQFALLGSLDLNSAFDVVNIDLFVKRLTIIALPNDVVELIGIWLEERSYYIAGPIAERS